jgi:hypothetical protein
MTDIEIIPFHPTRRDAAKFCKTNSWAAERYAMIYFNEHYTVQREAKPEMLNENL